MSPRNLHGYSAHVFSADWGQNIKRVHNNTIFDEVVPSPAARRIRMAKHSITHVVGEHRKSTIVSPCDRCVVVFIGTISTRRITAVGMPGECNVEVTERSRTGTTPIASAYDGGGSPPSLMMVLFVFG